jgi:acyl-coenzyme A synthetase/AMP-(fatty) acid ligase
MAHHFAVSIVLYLYHGATTIIEENHLGEDLLRAGTEQKATVMYGSPVHYRQLVEAPPATTTDRASARLLVVLLISTVCICRITYLSASRTYVTMTYGWL